MNFSPNKRYRGLCHNNITQKTKSEEKGTQEPDSDYLHVNWKLDQVIPTEAQ